MMFVSLNLILLSFFILLNSMAVRDSKRVRKALGSLLGTFGILEGGHNPLKEGVSVLPSDPMGRSEKRMEAKRREEPSELDVLLNRLNKKIGRKKVNVVPTADNIQIDFADEVMFRAGGVEVNPELFPVLDEIARVMKLIGRSVVVQGFTDPRSPNNYPSNLELSGSRAVRVARYLVEASQMDPRLVRVEGWGAPGSFDRKNPRYVKIVVPTTALKRSLENK
jgi:chemotaxis protein MotB